MSLLFCVRRVSLSQSFNSLKRLRHLSTESCTGRVLFFAERMVTSVSNEHHFYSAKIQKGDTDALLGPAVKLPPIPFKSLTGMDRSQVRNGFLCHREDSQFYIFSADTGEVSTLPEIPTPEFPCDRYMLEDSLKHYFGLDPLSNEPKVLLFLRVRAQGGSYDYEERFWIFTRGSGSWNRIHPSPPFFHSFRSAAFANGKIHWIYEQSDDYSYPRQSIFAFDFVEEKFREIPHPDDSFGGKLKLTTFAGRLALIKRLRENDKLLCWILEDNGKWIKETIHFPFSWRENMYVLAFDNNTGEMLLDSYEFSNKKKCLFYYNTKTRIFRTADLTGFPQWDHYLFLYPVEAKFHD